MARSVRSEWHNRRTCTRSRAHAPLHEQGRYVGAVVRGHAQYYGIAGNQRSIAAFRFAVVRLWRRTLGRRSQLGWVTWSRMVRLVKRWIPPVRLRYTDPDGHLCVMTQGRSPVR